MPPADDRRFWTRELGGTGRRERGCAGEALADEKRDLRDAPAALREVKKHGATPLERVKRNLGL